MVKRILLAKLMRFTIAAFLMFLPVSAKVERMDVFDKNGNNLFFVIFEYNADGINTGRSIYASDSTFLRRTVFVSDNEGKREREVSFNFNDDTVSYTNFSTFNNNPGITVFDQFNLDQFGAPASFAATGKDMYEVYHDGSVVYKIKYMYTQDGDLDRIEVLSTENTVLYYSSFISNVKTVRDHFRRKKSEPEIAFFANHCSISADLKNRIHLRVCVYDLSGRLVAVPFDKKLNPGVHNERFMSGKHDKKFSGGLYIFRMYIDGNPSGSSQKFILKTRSIR